ncbi:MAG: hypothetical protein H6718_03825 [Polyangiaceae bacterium]|nr:hypothetical protein [Myxococcales bacterium]MCB9584496.1 hypothetical protein [Polyangiaceae bacterium]MCB9609339.1 hypothetical protein [Polyangiaceae bacterium]
MSKAWFRGLAAVSLISAGSVGCSSNGASPDAGNGGAGATAGSGGEAGATAGTGGVGATAGTGGAAGASNPNAYALVISNHELDRYFYDSYSDNLDGLDADTPDADHCRGFAGEHPAQFDRFDGLDNSYAELDASHLYGDIADLANHAMTFGVSTVLSFEVADDGTVAGALLRSRGEGEYGTYATVWHPATQNFSNGAPLAVLSGRLDGDALELTGTGAFEMHRSYAGLDGDYYYRLRIRSYRIHATLTRDEDGSVTISDGSITGVVLVQEAIDAVREVYGNASGDCNYEAREYEDFRRAADMRSDGTNGDGSLPCDAISIGVGFDARSITLGASDADLPMKAKCL